jgi:phosphohistidine phosphatase SixA
MATIYLIRHAHAGSRRSWAGDDRARPLSDKGVRQAENLARALAGARPARILSSPATRCVQSVEPLAAALSIPVELHAALHEGADPSETVTVLEQALVTRDADAGIVACTHGDVMPEVVRLVALRGATVDGPSGNDKGSWWTLDHDGERFTTARWWPPA